MIFKRAPADRRKLLEKVLALVLRGRHAAAIAPLEEALRAGAPDGRLLLKLAELRRHEGDDRGAAAAFAQAARVYDAQGFGLRAAAALRQAISLAPDDLSLLAALADANLRLGLVCEAVRSLEALAAALTARNDRALALTVRHRILELVPGDVGAAVRLADLLVQMDRGAEALRVLRRAAEGPDPRTSAAGAEVPGLRDVDARIAALLGGQGSRPATA